MKQLGIRIDDAAWESFQHIASTFGQRKSIEHTLTFIAYLDTIDKGDATIGPVVAAIQMGDFDRALKLIRRGA